MYTHAPHSTLVASEPALEDLSVLKSALQSLEVGQHLSLTQRYRLRVRGHLGSSPTIDIINCR